MNTRRLACPNTTADCGCANPISMGTHTVEAGNITYVGLYPVWLPYVMGNSGGWNSTIVVRNNQSTFRAQVNTTFFNTDGTVRSQRTDYINTNQCATLAPPGNFSGSAIVVSSEDAAVVVENRNGALAYAYTGQMSPATTLDLPETLQHHNTIWHTNIRALNTGPAATDITTRFYNADGSVPASGGTSTLPNVAANGSGDVSQSSLPSGYLGAGRMTANQPVAAVVRVSDSSAYRRLGYTSNLLNYCGGTDTISYTGVNR